MTRDPPRAAACAVGDCTEGDDGDSEDAQAAARDYLVSLRDPSALRDHAVIAELQARIDKANDGLERLRLRQDLLNLQDPPLERYEATLVEHAVAGA